MTRIFIYVFVAFLAFAPLNAQTVAAKRAARMGLGMNLSFLENWWVGTADKHYSDFVHPEDAAKHEKMFVDIARAGFKTVRIPICFGAWASLEPPYRWENTGGLETADRFVNAALRSDLNVIIDLHHTEFDGKVKGVADTERIVWLWKQIAARYKNTDLERVFFELRNEPHDIEPEVWRVQAEEIIKAVRAITPKHTLIVGFHDWNSRQALIDSKPFTDDNLIYTFHYYDPFVFTHQGSTWAVKGLEEVKHLPFPGPAEIKVPESLKGSWVEKQLNNYQAESQAEKMYADLKAAKDWSERNRVPIFMGEFGSYSKYSDMPDRCRHAAVVYSALGKLDIPNAWWEWDGGFNMFQPGTTKIADCMRKAVEAFNARQKKY